MDNDACALFVYNCLYADRRKYVLFICFTWCLEMPLKANKYTVLVLFIF